VLIILAMLVGLAADPLLWLLAGGVGAALRDRPPLWAAGGGVAVALVLEALVSVMAAQYGVYAFGRYLVLRGVAAIAIALGARAVAGALARRRARRA